ncbi:MAG: Nif3-like dinuclear metal center hexameric protein [Peptococcaceae bacterium]
MAIKCGDIIKVLETLAHPKHGEHWDKIGLQVGDAAAEINRVMVTLDVTLPVIEEAVQKKVDLLVVHHTPLFNPLGEIRWDKPLGKIVRALIKADLSLYCAHTNLDSAKGGVSDVLAQKAGLQDVRILLPNWQQKYYKLVVFVPGGYEDQVRSALGRAGAGFIGNYSDCTFQLAGLGTFRPREGTRPFIGEKDRLEKVEEFRIETIVPEEKLQDVLEVMVESHPYEEVAYDVYPLANQGPSTGLGRIGELVKEISLQDLMDNLSAELKIDYLRYVGDINSSVKKVALCGGSGASLIKYAVKQGADVFVTGDIKYHEAQEAESLGLALIDAGHFATENPVVEVVAQYLREAFGAEINVVVSEMNTNPFEFYKR